MKCAMAAVMILGLCALAQSALAQRDPGVSDTTNDVAAAARAFQDGQKAQLAGNFARAAELFELADQLAPAPEAIRSAVRTREAAGQPARAATMALEAKLRYPDDAETVTTADAVLARITPTLARLSVRCESLCTLLVDGEALTLEPVTQLEAFVPTGAHRLEARFGAGRKAVEALELVAGEQRELELHAPPPPKRPAATPPPADHRNLIRGKSGAGPRASATDGGLPPWLFIGASALTVVAAGAAIVSSVDSFDKRDAYESEPTEQRYEAGIDSQRRTNALLITTGGLAAVSALLLAFADWDGEEKPSSTPTFALSPVAPNLVVRSTFQ